MAKLIKKIMYREKKLAEIASKSGGFTEEFAKEKFNINGKRLQALCNSKFFKLHEFYRENENGKLERKRAFALGIEGKKYVKENNICETTQGLNGYRHTVSMQEVVYDLVYKQDYNITDILNEKEQEKYFQDEINKAKAKNIDFRINDVAIVTDIEIRVIEVETNYSSKLIAQHQAYSEQVLNVPYESVKG